MKALTPKNAIKITRSLRIFYVNGFYANHANSHLFYITLYHTLQQSWVKECIFQNLKNIKYTDLKIYFKINIFFILIFICVFCSKKFKNRM